MTYENTVNKKERLAYKRKKTITRYERYKSISFRFIGIVLCYLLKIVKCYLMRMILMK